MGTELLGAFAGAKVLAVDDVEANVLLLRELLKRSGIPDIHTVTDSRQAVQEVNRLSPDIVLLDLHMPHVDGYQVLAALAAMDADTPDGAQRELPPSVLIVTADTNREAAHRALGLGAQDFITKPFDATEVVLRVRNALEARFLAKTLRRHNIDLQEQLELSKQNDRREAELRESQRNQVRRVLDSGGPTVVFQPIVATDGTEVIGYEALARFPAPPNLGPHEWFAVAAHVGLGPELEAAAVANAVASLDRLPDTSYLAVNVSPQALQSGHLDWITSHPASSRLVLELTEHVPVEDYLAVRKALAPLREKGVRLAVDDTGAGFASFRHILGLEPEIIKLDMSLVQGLATDPARRALAAALVSFAGEVDAALVAEGVETAQDLTALRALGVRSAQGYHLGRPAAL
jgi:EAL domain-containing protein (putative c-di-GMP-specific phosphodiesterase class I)/DNA-binding response OmpR family regulator